MTVTITITAPFVVDTIRSSGRPNDYYCGPDIITGTISNDCPWMIIRVTMPWSVIWIPGRSGTGYTE
jgi:hypothetical protein